MSVNVSVPAHLGGASRLDHPQFVVADESDDVGSLCSKLGQIAGQRVALVLPEDSDVFDSPVAMHVLARLAARESISLAIVTSRRRARYWADLEGLLTFSSVSQIPRVPDSARAAGANPFLVAVGEALADLRWLARWVLAVGIVLGLVGMGVLLIPRAIVRVTPVTDRLQSTVRIQASVDATDPDPTKGIVPGRSVVFPVDATGSIPIERPDHPLDGLAVGSVTFENRTSDAVSIPTGTVVSTLSGTPFQTRQKVVLPGRPGATAVVPIKALYPGAGSNVKRGEIIVVGGPLHWRVTLVNEDAIGGGGRYGVPIVTTMDTQALLANLTAEAQRDGIQRLAQQTGAGEVAIPETIRVTPIEETFDHQIGDVAPTLGVKAQFRAEAMIVNQAQIADLVIRMWQPTIRSGFALASRSVTAGTPVVAQVSPTTTTFNVPVSGVAYQTINTDRVAEYVRMRTPPAAENDIDRQFDVAAPTEITIVPNWLGWAYRVEVDVDTSASPTTSQR